MMAWGIWIDVAKVVRTEPGAATDVKKVRKLMEVKGQGSEGGRETVKDDGSGDLDWLSRRVPGRRGGARSNS